MVHTHNLYAKNMLQHLKYCAKHKHTNNKYTHTHEYTGKISSTHLALCFPICLNNSSRVKLLYERVCNWNFKRLCVISVANKMVSIAPHFIRTLSIFTLNTYSLCLFRSVSLFLYGYFFFFSLVAIKFGCITSTSLIQTQSCANWINIDLM